MESLSKTTALKAVKLRRKIRPQKAYPSATTPSLTLSIQELIHRSNFGTLTQQGLKGVYHSDKLPEFEGYENMDKVEKSITLKKFADSVTAKVKDFQGKVFAQKQEENKIKLQAIKDEAVAEYQKAQKSAEKL